MFVCDTCDSSHKIIIKRANFNNFNRKRGNRLRLKKLKQKKYLVRRTRRPQGKIKFHKKPRCRCNGGRNLREKWRRWKANLFIINLQLFRSWNANVTNEAICQSKALLKWVEIAWGEREGEEGRRRSEPHQQY